MRDRRFVATQLPPSEVCRVSTSPRSTRASSTHARDLSYCRSSFRSAGSDRVFATSLASHQPRRA